MNELSNDQYGLKTLELWFILWNVFGIFPTVKQRWVLTNEGSSGRKFFINYENVSAIAGFDKELLKWFYVTLQLLSYGKNINTNLFRNTSRNL